MPTPIIFKAKDYNNRADLESAIKSQVENGNGINKGTRQELRQLLLSDQRKVFGCKVVSTDITTAQILADKRKKK